MPRPRPESPPQTDLFPPAEGGDPAAAARPAAAISVPPDFVDAVRRELADTLALARAATDRLPWPDLTRATLAELRFDSLAGTWLPPEEAAPLRAAFAAEMARLYDRHGADAAAAATA